MDAILLPPASYAEISEKLLAHRFPTGPASRAADMVDVQRAFHALAEVFALDQAATAGKTPREIMATLASGLAEAVQADAEILLKSAAGELASLRQPSPAIDPIAGEVSGDGKGRTSESGVACAPLVRQDREIVGVLQMSGKRNGAFEEPDLRLAGEVGACLAELAVAAGLLPWLGASVRLVSDAEDSSDDPDAAGSAAVLSRILAIAIDILGADRGWVFLYDPVMDELYSVLSEGLGNRQLRIGAQDGIAGATFRSGELISIAQAYQDPRFNPAIDWQIEYRTRNLMCAPIFSAEGKRLGVLQVVNKRAGAFDSADESHLRSLAAQMGVTLDYTTLFDQVLRMKSHNESMLRSLTNGVLTLDMRGEVTFVNQAALATLHRSEQDLLGLPVMKVFGEMNAWLLEAIDEVAQGLAEKQLPNSEFFIESAGEWVSANISLLPLLDARRRPLGFMLVMENLERERELRRTMSRYLSNEVIDRLMQDQGATLGGSAQAATTLFCDIRSFTSLSESLGAAETVSMLNEYFSFMEDVLTNRSAVIDKYIGDAIMAVFGLPFPGDDDAINSVKAACDMIQALTLLNARRAREGHRPIRIGVGIATGAVIAGNIGSSKRMDFTVIGDPVNLASRIEALTDRYGTAILICHETRARLRDPVKLRRVDVVRVRGQTRPTTLHEILDYRREEWTETLDRFLVVYEQGLDAYLAADWAAAAEHFEEALRLAGDDKASKLMLERCQRYSAAPPDHWDGVSP